MDQDASDWRSVCHACARPVPVGADRCPACGATVVTVAAEIARDNQRWIVQFKQAWPEFRRYLIAVAIVAAIVISARAIYEWRSEKEPVHATWFLNGGLYWLIGFAIIGFGAMVFLHIAANRMMKRMKEIDKTNDGR